MSEPAVPADASSHRAPPAWMFAFGGTAYGVAGALIGQLMPKLAGNAGIDLDGIGTFSLLLFIPSWFQFLIAPLVDVGPRRKMWLVIVAACSAASLVATFAMKLPDQKVPFLAFGFLAQTMAALISAACGGLLATTISDARRGAASAWYNLGNLSGGGAAGWLGIKMIGWGVPSVLVGLTIAACVLGPALVMLLIYEPNRTLTRTVKQVFGQTVHEVADILSTRSGVTAIVLFLSPVGTAALSNYFVALQRDFGASDDLVANISLVSSFVTAIGALGGGYLCDRHNRRAMYLLSGALTALVGVGFALATRTPTTYAIGSIVYYLVTGFCYAAFTATVLETIGNTSKAAATRYAMCVSAGNIAISWVGKVDTKCSTIWGLNGVFVSDVVLNLAFVVLLAIVFWRLGSFGNRPTRTARELPTAIAKDKAS